MLLACLFSFIAAPALAVQVPFRSGSGLLWQEGRKATVPIEESRIEWNLHTPPHPNDTDHLVFETVYSLLQSWPNTRMRNGHNIVPGIIPKGTLLYRSSNDNELPAKPDWVAMDPELAYLFCRDTSPPASFSPQGCWELTLVTTRPLKVVYFDGASGAKIPYGSLDTQDLLAWGKTSSGKISDERPRIEKLCEWAKKFDVDAFVRTAMSFEAMLCNFTSGVSVASLANLVDRGSISSMAKSIPFEYIHAGSWRNRFPGETRVKLDLTGLVSFYDTKLVPSLIPIRAGQERWDHRVANISSKDLAAVKSRLEAILVRPSGLSSGFDWRTLFQTIVDRYAGRLELARHLLNSPAGNPEEILDLANKTQIQLRIMLTPYIFVSATPTDPLDKADLDWTTPIYKFCATIHTQFMESELDSMTDSERLLLQAVQATNREICRVVTRMWAAGVYAGIDPSLNAKDSPDITEISQVLGEWEADLNSLMTWLDWSVWVKCQPGCGPQELCYLPTWPFGFPTLGDRPDTPLDDWTRPQPRCIPRVNPYDPILW